MTCAASLKMMINTNRNFNSFVKPKAFVFIKKHKPKAIPAIVLQIIKLATLETKKKHFSPLEVNWGWNAEFLMRSKKRVT